MSAGRAVDRLGSGDGVRMPPYARGLYARFLARFAERMDPRVRRLRAEAVARLALAPGARVLDVACGTGLSFPFLVDAVGPAGEVVGVDISPVLAAEAQARVARHGWRNVRVVVSPADSAPLEGAFEGLLLFAAHEVLTSPAALDHLFGHLAPGARVATFGARRVPPPLGLVVNPLLALASRRMLPFSPPIDERPWRGLEARLVRLAVTPHWGGTMYLASGEVPRPGAAGSHGSQDLPEAGSAPAAPGDDRPAR